jgi:hypothetical protein
MPLCVTVHRSTDQGGRSKSVKESVEDVRGTLISLGAADSKARGEFSQRFRRRRNPVGGREDPVEQRQAILNRELLFQKNSGSNR